MQSLISFTLNGEQFSVDLGKLTFAEGRAIESRTGDSLTDSMNKKDLTFIQAVVWVSMKRSKPGTLFSDLDNVPIADVEFENPEDKENEPVPSQPTGV